MAALTLEKMKDDQTVMSVARALTVANEAALTHGVQPANSLVTISEEPSNGTRLWRINYGLRDYVQRRGGDLIVFIEDGCDTAQRVMRGQ